MPKVYAKGDKDDYELLADVMHSYHRELAEAEVRVGLRLVTNTERPALMVHGHPALARVKRVTPNDRIFLDYDAIIDIDGAAWLAADEPAQRALLDHELTHVMLAKDARGNVKRAGDRPQIELQPDDWMLTGFREVIERHGKHALEARALERLCTQTLAPFTTLGDQQYLFAFMDPDAAPAAAPKRKRGAA